MLGFTSLRPCGVVIVGKTGSRIRLLTVVIAVTYILITRSS